ncbi:hypothetical protein FANTH_11795 [Fusarium anthophilum]|uniref:Uncharacterized protein n=1 Tax=Fusarium anthophilum TaxID=48485 RepID=A0A8H5DTE2_9HYPO|nr:hypothetical protein FANTH_11795 [Fusarium anthophilum]
MRDTERDRTYEEVKHLLLSNQYYAQLALDCDCKADCYCSGISTWKGGDVAESDVSESDVSESDACEESDASRLNLFAMEDYELRPIPYLEYIIHETPNRMKNIFRGLEYDPQLTVGLWDKREGSFYGEKVPYLQRRRAGGDDVWETLYRDAEYLPSNLLRFDHVNHSNHKSLFIFAVAMNIKECSEIKDFNMPKRIFRHFRRLLGWASNRQPWSAFLERNKYYLQDSHEKYQSASFDSPYLGYPRQDCEKEEEYRSLIHLTDNGLLVLGGQGPDRGPDWRGGRTFQSTHKEYRRLPCLEFVIPDDPRSDFVSNLIADGKLAVNVHRGDGSVYTTDPNCCEYLQRDLKPGRLWEQQQVPQRSLRHFCLDHLPFFKQQEVLICTVAMKITEDTKDMLMGNEEDFVEVSTAFDLIHRILCNKGGLVSLNHVKNLYQMSEVYDDFINQNFERQDVKHLKTLRRNGLFVLKGPEFYESRFTTYEIPLLKIAFVREPIKRRFIVRISGDPKLAVGCWNGQDGQFRDMNVPKIYGALSVDNEDHCFPNADEEYPVKIHDIPKGTVISLQGIVEPLKDQNVSICIIAMRVDKLIEKSDKTELLQEIENFDIAKCVASHIKAVNAAGSIQGIISSKRTDDSDKDDRSDTRKQNGKPKQVTSGLTMAKELSNQPGERCPFDINFDELLIKGITPLGEFWLHERYNPGNAYIFRKADIPHTLRNDIGVAEHLKRIDAQSLSRVNLRLIEVGAIAVGRGGSTSILVTLRGEDQLFVLSKTALNKALSKKDAKNFMNKNKDKLQDAGKRRASYLKWREGCQ